MQTFFVTYNTGEYDSYQEHVYSIDAESKEAIFDEISRAIDVYVDYQEKYHAARSELDKKYRPKNTKTAGKKDWEIWHQEYNKFNENNPYVYWISFFGNKLAVFDEIRFEDKMKAIESAGLDIMTVNEYIESCRPDKEEK
jgi:hypothetical protein